MKNECWMNGKRVLNEKRMLDEWQTSVSADCQKKEIKKL